MIDIRKIALELELQQKPLWVERWQCWVIVQELTGEERADLLQKCTEVVKNTETGKREGKVNLKRLYPMLAILTVRYPIASVLPELTHPHYALYPGAKDEQGNYLTPPLPENEEGKIVFALTELAALNKRSGVALEQISTVASSLSGLTPEEIEEKKKDSVPSENEKLNGQTVESDGYTIE